MLYSKIIRPCLFRLDPEDSHHLALSIGGLVKAKGVLDTFLRYCNSTALNSRNRNEPITVGNLTFPNHLGLAAGCDKDCKAVDLFAALGFGHIEIGTVTPLPQVGNPRPRIFRIAQDAAIINRMGFPSAGADVVAARLTALRARYEQINKSGSTFVPPVIGVNVGKMKETALDRASEDYCHTITKFGSLADYFAVNVSSPNTPELRKLQEREPLLRLFSKIKEIAPSETPLFVKVAPDLDDGQLNDLVECVAELGLTGIIATNTTISRPQPLLALAHGRVYGEVGGLSGEPLADISLTVVRKLVQMSRARFQVIGVGGINSSARAQAMLESGAVLVQVYSGLIFKGPGLVKELLAATWKA